MHRWLKAALIVAAIMITDLLALIGVTRAFLPGRPPMWATAVPFWLLAWPVTIFGRIFPNTNPAGNDRGPSMIAVGLSGLVDIALLMALVLWIMRRREAGKAAGAA